MKVFYIALILGCSGFTMCMAKESKYEDLVGEIKSEVVDLTSFYSLFSVDSFVRIFNRPEDWSADAARAMIADSLDDQEKVIVALSMQKLPKNEYVKFLRSVYSGWQMGNVTEGVFRQVIFPGYSWNTTLIVHRKDPAVEAFLGELNDDNKLPNDLREWLGALEMGELTEDLEMQKSAGMVHVLPDDFVK